MRQLEKLALRKGFLYSLPHSLSSLSNLTSLSLFDNNFRAIPVAIGELTGLVELDLGRNFIQDIGILSKLGSKFPEYFPTLTLPFRFDFTQFGGKLAH